tara:strand:+ start:13421 stop:15070 length:1650 start_codon:yes stop_codon:yes gene_type:complete
MANTGLYAGITQGLSEVADYERGRPARERKATMESAEAQSMHQERRSRQEDRTYRQQEAKTRQTRSKAEFEQSQTLGATQQSKAELQLEQLQGQLKEEKGARLKNETYGAFKQYNADGDTRHLNNFLKSAKQMGDPTWSHWSRFDAMTRTPQTEAMLGQAGVTDIDAYFSDPNLVRSKVLATDANGEQSLLDMNKLQQGTGFTQHMTTEELQQARERAAVDQLMMGAQSAETSIIHEIAKEEGISLLEANKRYKAAKGNGGSTVERVAQKLRDENPDMTFEESLKQAARAQAAPSGAEKDIEVTKGIREQLHGLSGSGSFYDADLNDPKTREKAGELIVDLEKATGRKLTGETKKAARQMRSLLRLGSVAGAELTDDETGIIDNVFHRVKKYFSDNIEGTAGTTAYNAMRNVQRNALMGATLTKAELKAFDQAAGTLGQQLGPVLAAMKTSMQDVKEQLQTIVDFEDPMAAKYYLGTSMEQAEMAIDAIDERLRHFQSYEQRASTGEELKVSDVTKPKVQVNMPAPATPDGSKPAVSASERWKQLKGTN